MDALQSAYPSSDDDHEAPAILAGPSFPTPPLLLVAPCPEVLPPRLTSPSVPVPSFLQPPSLSDSLPVSGRRYVSKRERAVAAASSCLLSSIPQHSQSLTPSQEGVLHMEMHLNMRKKLKPSSRNQLPKGLFLQFKAHQKPISALRWSPTHGSLLLSSGMDAKTHVWDVWSGDSIQRARRTFSNHSAAVKDAQWSSDGTCILTCGFDCTSRLIDVESGSEVQVFKEDQYVNVVKYHPIKKDVFLSGGSKGSLKLWDVRTGGMVQEYHKDLGEVMDIDFHRDGNRFVSASDIAAKNVSEKAIIVWDFATQIPLSNQVYLEAYTCSCVRYHPWENNFVAQSNGSYIALFSGDSPFKMNKYKRFEGHQVCGFRIQCNFCPDGGLLVSGSSDGRVYVYQYASAQLLKVLEAHSNVCTDVSYHPSMHSVLASGGWEGVVCIFK